MGRSLTSEEERVGKYLERGNTKFRATVCEKTWYIEKIVRRIFLLKKSEIIMLTSLCRIHGKRDYRPREHIRDKCR
jgi:hypothetical protein